MKMNQKKNENILLPVRWKKMSKCHFKFQCEIKHENREKREITEREKIQMVYNKIKKKSNELFYAHSSKRKKEKKRILLNVRNYLCDSNTKYHTK